MKASLELIRPLLAARGTEPAGRVVIGTVKGDLHDIGKNLVAAMLEGGGFEVNDLGVDVAPERFVGAVQEKGAGLVALSALLTTTMPSMRGTIEALAAAGLRARVKVMVGGAPLTQRYADEIGADGYSENAAGAVALARRLAAA
jgi:5-methyltetrahydrofolate--homocysteine methyltransferase